MRSLAFLVTPFLITLLSAAQDIAPIPGDINHDGTVNEEDLLILQAHWHLGEMYTPTPSPSSLPQGAAITVALPGLPAGAKPLEMVLIPAGTFTMGSPESEPGRSSNEGPQHQVTISKPFYLGKYELTQAQWSAVMGSNPAEGHGVGDNYPVYNVSWNDCQAFIEKLNVMGLGAFRLPTEAEWEYACRAGTTTPFYWGDDPKLTKIRQCAWYGGNSQGGTHEVGLLEPNAWGLFDMSGNVWECCWDGHSPYSADDQIDPKAEEYSSFRVLRGGAWGGSSALWCRSACRYGCPVNLTSRYFGLRVAASQTN
jgi:formylglycine-generating enzyme required for sulfatase activity